MERTRMSGDDGSWEGLEEAKFSRKEVEMIWHSHAFLTWLYQG